MYMRISTSGPCPSGPTGQYCLVGDLVLESQVGLGEALVKAFLRNLNTFSDALRVVLFLWLPGAYPSGDGTLAITT